MRTTALSRWGRKRPQPPGSFGALALLATITLALSAAPEARAQQKDAPAASGSKADEASQHFKSGVSFYKDRDFPAAMVEFKKAYELLPNYNVLFNLGQTARELKDYAAALNAFEQYLRDGGAKVQAARKKEVTAAIEELKTKVGKIKVVLNVDGADVLVDDVSVGPSPLASPVTVNVGTRKLSVTSSGYTPLTRMVDVSSMGESTVTLELTKIGAGAPAAPPEEKPKPGVPIYTWVTVGATGACAILTGVMGGLALSARSGLKDELGRFPGNGGNIADAQSRTKTFATTADVFGGLTIAGAVATTLLFVLVPRLTEKSKPAVSVGVSPTGISMSGSF